VLQEAETAGEEGRVDHSVKLMEEVEALRVQKATAQARPPLLSRLWFASPAVTPRRRCTAAQCVDGVSSLPVLFLWTFSFVEIARAWASGWD
jgi:hypothetical protein